jgi:hypothetical protein
MARLITKRRVGSLALALMTILPGQGVFATTETGAGTVNVLPALEVEFYQHLNFGTIAPSTTQASTVKVLRGNDNSSICGPGLSCLANGNRARIRVTGAPGRLFSVTDPGSITLTDGNGNSMLVDSFIGAGSRNDSAFGGVRQVRSNGQNNMNIGATLYVGVNQPPGLYTGTYTISANYE